jgi:CBS domain-containing protein/uncharacterized protein (DUF2267 family)
MSLDRYRRPRLLLMGPRATAREAARAMADHHLGAVLVTEGRDLLGIVTDRDLALEIVGGDLDGSAAILADVMSEPVWTLDVGASVTDAAALMRAHACRRVPITEDGVVVGLVALDDLLAELDAAPLRAALAAELGDLRAAAGLEPPDETRARARTRRRAHAEGTYNRLLHTVERYAGIRERARAERALGIVLGAICRRLTPQEARHLVGQLPSKLHAELAECLDGPDKRITTATIETELQRELDLDGPEAGDVLHAICTAVADGISEGETRAVRDQLPGAMKDLFPAAPSRRAG